MIYSSQITARISALLKLSGVTDDDVIEEMTDHYLTEIDDLVSEGANPNTAIRIIYQKIAQTDFETISPKKKNKNKRIFFFALLIVAIFGYFNFESDRPIEEDCTSDSIAAYLPPSGWPLSQESRDVTSNFGYVYHPVGHRKHHNGIDIKAKFGTDVLATGDAEVSEMGYTKSSGHFLVLRHNCSYSTRYNHLSSIDVTDCQVITSGDKIGEVGNSGMSLFPHLHYEILRDKMPIDPFEIIRP